MNDLIDLLDSFQEACEYLAGVVHEHEEVAEPAMSDCAAARAEIVQYVENLITRMGDSDEKHDAAYLLGMAGVTDVENVAYADAEALRRLLADIVISTEFRKLVQYLRS